MDTSNFRVGVITLNYPYNYYDYLKLFRSIVYVKYVHRFHVAPDPCHVTSLGLIGTRCHATDGHLLLLFDGIKLLYAGNNISMAEMAK